MKELQMRFAVKRCTLCGKPKRATFFKGRPVCDHCLDYIKSNF